MTGKVELHTQWALMEYVGGTIKGSMQLFLEDLEDGVIDEDKVSQLGFEYNQISREWQLSVLALRELDSNKSAQTFFKYYVGEANDQGRGEHNTYR